MDQILLPALSGQLHDFQEFMRGEDLALNLPGESQLLLGAAPPKSSELSGSFRAANCPGNIYKKKIICWGKLGWMFHCSFVSEHVEADLLLLPSS